MPSRNASSLGRVALSCPAYSHHLKIAEILAQGARGARGGAAMAKLWQLWPLWHVTDKLFVFSKARCGRMRPCSPVSSRPSTRLGKGPEPNGQTVDVLPAIIVTIPCATPPSVDQYQSIEIGGISVRSKVLTIISLPEQKKETFRSWSARDPEKDARTRCHGLSRG
jgi:hypothetical protein